MSISEIACKLLATSNVVHEVEHQRRVVALQNWTNTLTDQQLNRLWQYAGKKGLERVREFRNGVLMNRYIFKSDLEDVAKGGGGKDE